MGYIICGIIWLMLGTVLFLAGTLEWKPWQNPLRLPDKKKAMIYAGVIATAGLFTTKGWNDFSAYGQRKAEEAFNQSLQKTNQQFKQDLDDRDQKFKADQTAREVRLRMDQKKSLILAIAREWKANDLKTQTNPFVLYEHPDPNAKQAYNYPLFEDRVLKMARTSDLFSYKSPEDMRLIIPVVNYELAIESANVTLAYGNDLRGVNVIGYADKSVFGDQGAYPPLLARHKKLGELLKKEYRWVLDDIDRVFLVDPNRNRVP